MVHFVLLLPQLHITIVREQRWAENSKVGTAECIKCTDDRTLWNFIIGSITSTSWKDWSVTSFLQKSFYIIIYLQNNLILFFFWLLMFFSQRNLTLKGSDNLIPSLFPYTILPCPLTLYLLFKTFWRTYSPVLSPAWAFFRIKNWDIPTSLRNTEAYNLLWRAGVGSADEESLKITMPE